MTTLRLALLLLGSFSLLVILSTFAATWIQRTRKRARASSSETELAISVLKPLCGVDDGLADNLRALFEQDHQSFEILIGCADPADPALDVARAVRAEYPQRQVKIVVGRTPTGANPKVRVLRMLEEFAEHEWLLISDSNVRPTPRYLHEIEATQREKSADLVHCLLAGGVGRTLGERLEDLQLCGWVAPTVSLTDLFHHPCVVGKSMLLRRSMLRAVGGLEGVADVLAEDYVLGSRIHQAGGTVGLSSYVLPVINRGRGFSGFVNRHVRWGQMRRRIAPGYFAAELLGQPLLFLGPLLLCSPSHRWFAAVGLLLKWTAEAVHTAQLTGQLPGSIALLLPIKDLLILLMWPVSFFQRTVSWRGHRMLVMKGSYLVPCSPQLSSPRLTHEPDVPHAA